MEIPPIRIIRSVLNRSTSQRLDPFPLPISQTPGTQNKEGIEVDAPFREVAGSLVWIESQRRPNIVITVRAIARFQHDPKPIHPKATQNITEHLNSSLDLCLLFTRGGELGSIQVECDLSRMQTRTTSIRLRTDVPFLKLQVQRYIGVLVL